MKFVMIFGPSGVGKETIARRLGHKKGWHVFPQHLAFDIASAVVGFGNDGFEKYQRDVCLKALKTLYFRNAKGVVFTFCYVSKASDFFIEGLLTLLQELEISSEFFHLKCDLDEHVRRVTSEGRRNTNKIQTKEYLLEYLKKFNFSPNIPGVSSTSLDTTNLSAEESAGFIESKLRS